MTGECLIGVESDYPVPFGDGGAPFPFIDRACCDAFKEDFEDDCAAYSLCDEGLVVTYDELYGDKLRSKVEIVKVCPYCGAKIVIQGCLEVSL